MEYVLHLLNSIYPLQPATIDYIVTHVRSKKAEKDEILLRPGETCRRLYFIQSGLLRAYELRGDTEVSVWFMKENDFTCDVQSFYRQVPTRKFIQALAESDLLYLTHDNLQHLYHHHMEFNFVARELQTLYYLLWDERLDVLNMNNNEVKYEWLLHNRPDLLQRVPQKFLASYFNMTEVTFSKMKNRLNNKNANGKG